MRQYLLGMLDEEEQQRLERELLRDVEAFEELQALENELLYDYAKGGLLRDEGRRFEERYLGSPEGQHKLEQARALLSRVAPTAAKATRPALPFLATAAALAVGLGLGWLALRGTPPSEVARESRPIPSGLPPAGPFVSLPASPVSPIVPPTAGPSAALYALALAPGLTREGGEPRRIVLPPEATVVRLQLDLPPASTHLRYRAALRTAEGEAVWTGSGPWPGLSHRVLVLEIPARRLKEADYELTLSAQTKDGVEEIADHYFFGVLRR